MYFETLKVMKRVKKSFIFFFKVKQLRKLYDMFRVSHRKLLGYFRFLLIVIFVLVVSMFSFDFIHKYISNPSIDVIDSKESSEFYFNNSFSEAPYKESIVVSEILPNCGINHECAENEFPVHVYTGQDKDDVPKLCVGGKYVQGVGRGLNIAVIESNHATFKSLRNFDLYSQNSSALEAWLENDLNKDDIIIAFTFDEASKELSNNAKEILYLLGSGKIQDLQFRCQWYMISQKGIKGFSPLEDITYGKNYRWGKAIDKKLCVPKTMKPLMVSPDPWPRQNPLRERLCEVCSELRSDRFCGDLDRHEPLLPSQLTNRSLIGNPIFSTPIIIIPGSSLSSLALTLETLLYQPGIQPAMVFIIHNQNNVYIPTLAKLFGYRSLLINSSFPFTTNDKIEYGMSYVIENYSGKEFAIILEEGIILASDFLYYMAQMVPFLREDDSILGVSAWNPYGYKETSGNLNVVYRTEDFPGLAFLVRTSLFLTRMKGRMHQCCIQKSFLGWNIGLNGHILVPDVSRVLKRPRDYYHRTRKDAEFYMFTSPRLTSRDSLAWIEKSNDLIQENYDNYLTALVNSSINIRISDEDLFSCSNMSSWTIRIIRELQSKTISILYKETEANSTEVLKKHLNCFNIRVSPQAKVHNLYKKTLQLTVHTNVVIFVEARSIFLNKGNL